MKEKEKKKIIRRLDKIGRIVIPKEIRKRFEIIEDDPIEIFVDKDTIILKKYEKNCTFCGSRKKLIEYNDKLICADCKEKIGDLFGRDKK